MLLFSTLNYLKGLFVIWNVIFDAANATSFQGKLLNLSLISTLFNLFIKPHLKTLDSNPLPRAYNEIEGPIERVVKLKIKQLQPFLQDDDTDEAENDITLEGNDETTIVEFVPQTGDKFKTGLRNGNDTFKANMQKYKRVRNKIYEALDEEMVSDKTKTLVIQTMDELLSKMVETQCNWKGGIESIADNINGQFIVPRTIINMWKEEWQKFRTKFSPLTRQRARNQVNNFGTLMTYLTKLNSIINDISVNLESFTKKYKISCNVTDINDIKRNDSKRQKLESLRLSYDIENEKDVCKNFKVCSKELKTFFIDFYNSLNDTAVTVLRSYAEMFTRDVNTDVSNEKNSIVDLIYKIGDEAEKHIIKTFVNHTTHFHLDEHKQKGANVNFLEKYIINVIKQVKQVVKKDMIAKLNHLHKKVSSGIQKDVEVNLGVDLGNLERDLTGKICLMFNICNGNTKTRRHGGTEAEKENSLNNENKVYVKVEVTIEDENDILENSNISTSLSQNSKNVFTQFRNYKKPSTLNYEKYANMTVTRTTLMQAL